MGGCIRNKEEEEKGEREKGKFRKSREGYVKKTIGDGSDEKDKGGTDTYKKGGICEYKEEEVERCKVK